MPSQHLLPPVLPQPRQKEHSLWNLPFVDHVGIVGRYQLVKICCCCIILVLIISVSSCEEAFFWTFCCFYRSFVCWYFNGVSSSTRGRGTSSGFILSECRTEVLVSAAARGRIVGLPEEAPFSEPCTRFPHDISISLAHQYISCSTSGFPRLVAAQRPIRQKQHAVTPTSSARRLDPADSGGPTRCYVT